jgi:2-(1,2-epoxy-1,2-dihydrophenyl)acetyl-CoA isomerase
VKTDDTDGPVVLTTAGGVAWIELNRPESYNALDTALAEALTATVSAIAADPTVRSVLLTGRGRAFCAGGDVTAMAAAVDRQSMVFELAGAAHKAVLALLGLEVPVVAVVQGSAAGAGLAFTLVADLVVAAESAVLMSAYAGIGVTPDCGTSWLLPQVVGLRRAMELALLNRRLTAAEALDWGLVTRVHPDGEVLEAGRELAERLASGPSPALGITRKLLRASSGRGLAEHLEQEAEAIASTIASPDSMRMVDAFSNR